MYIARLQVEEGFLDGLDVHFARGLNVIIGPRGSGKTSIIELIRYALGARGITERAGAVGEAHARSILSNGQVTITLRDESTEVFAIRSAAEDAPRLSGRIVPPTVLSQNEIESIGVSAAGRLRLIDAFRRPASDVQRRIEKVRMGAREATVNVREVSVEIDGIEEQIGALQAEVAQLGEKQHEYNEQLARIAAAEAKQRSLQELSATASRLGVEVGAFERAGRQLDAWLEAIQIASGRAVALEQWPKTAGEQDKLLKVRRRLNVAKDHAKSALQETQEAINELNALQASVAAERVKIEERARAIRMELEELNKGSGALARTLAELQGKAAEVGALKDLRQQLIERRREIVRNRDAMLDELDVLAGTAFSERNEIAQSLTTALARRIEVAVHRGGLTTKYESELLAALKGSNIRHGSLLPILVQKISPRELTALVERKAVSELAGLVGISLDRAARLVSALAERGLESVVACELDDAVSLSLLDGIEYKDSEHLSTGQRCTVVLPLLLARPGRTLVIDQPEDHLDNAFVVDVAVSSIRQRSEDSQYIFSTHNPNIPVIGGADRVVLMGSDGQRGFIRSCAALDDPASVEAITTVMEGGREAFGRRSAFYSKNRG